MVAGRVCVIVKNLGKVKVEGVENCFEVVSKALELVEYSDLLGQESDQYQHQQLLKFLD